MQLFFNEPLVAENGSKVLFLNPANVEFEPNP